MRSLAVAVLALLFACKDGSRPVNEPAEARAFAETLATDVIPTCDAAALTPRFAMKDKPLAAKILCEWVAGIHSYKVVGVKPAAAKGEPVHVIMRRLLADPDTGAMFVAYDDLAIKDKHIVEVFSYRQNVALSDLLEPNASGQGRPTDYLAGSSKHDAVRQAQTTLRGDDREGALKQIDALPPDVRREPPVQMLRLRVAARLGGETYKQALDELAKTFPDDPGIALTEIDGALDFDDFDGAMRWIDVLEKTIGVDAYLEGLRVIALTRKGDLDKALAAADAAVKLEPTLTRALEIKLDVLIAKKMWPEALDVMTELETTHGSHFDTGKLRSEPRLAELVQLPIFDDWAAAHDDAPPASP